MLHTFNPRTPEAEAGGSLPGLQRVIKDSQDYKEEEERKKEQK